MVAWWWVLVAGYIGAAIGAAIGYFVACLMTVSASADRQAQAIERSKDYIEVERHSTPFLWN
jgi:Na+-driven multidrug efflux pump